LVGCGKVAADDQAEKTVAGRGVCKYFFYLVFAHSFVPLLILSDGICLVAGGGGGHRKPASRVCRLRILQASGASPKQACIDRLTKTSLGTKAGRRPPDPPSLLFYHMIRVGFPGKTAQYVEECQR